MEKKQLTPEEGKTVKNLNPVSRRWAIDLLLKGRPLDRALLYDYNETEGQLYRSWLNLAINNMRKVKLERGVQIWLNMLTKDVSLNDVKSILKEARKNSEKSVVKMLKMLESFERDALRFYEVTTKSLAAGHTIEHSFIEGMRLPSVSVEFRDKFEDRLFVKQCLFHWQNKKSRVAPETIKLALTDFSHDKKITEWQWVLLHMTLKHRDGYEKQAIKNAQIGMAKKIIAGTIPINYHTLIEINLSEGDLLITNDTVHFYEMLEDILKSEPLGATAVKSHLESGMKASSDIRIKRRIKAIIDKI